MNLHSALFSVTYKKNVPLMCVFELTHRCNLKCAHCYICRSGYQKELDTEEIKDVLSQISSLGCMYIVFSGGEVFLRKDIFEICGFAKSLHFDVRIFSNAALIDSRAAKKIKDLAVSSVEISLYGRERIHERVTGVRGSFGKTLNGIMELKKNGVSVTLKCPVMKMNYSDYHWVKGFARRNGFGCKFDITISPRDDGGRGPLKLRLRKPGVREVFTSLGTSGPRTLDKNAPADFSCSAGRNFFSITPYGKVLPCLQLPVELGDVRKRSFGRIWNSAKTAFIRGIGREKIKICTDCADRTFCRRCPGFAMLEDGDLFGPAKSACRLAEIQSSI